MKIPWLWYSIILLALVVGIVLGMLLGTYAVIDHVAQGLAGSEFNVNLNETKLIEEMNKTIILQIIKEASSK